MPELDLFGNPIKEKPPATHTVEAAKPSKKTEGSYCLSKPRPYSVYRESPTVTVIWHED